MTEISKDLQKKIERAVVLEKEFIEQMYLVNDLQNKAKQFWKEVETAMINSGTKSFKGDWGSITIAEKMAWAVDLDLLPKKFIKRVADTKKLSDTFRLENKPIKGAEPKYSKYLTKRIK